MELRPIDRTDRAVTRLHAALNIYRDTILPEAQNPERQILYWIEHSKENLADEFRCFAIVDRQNVVGYFQYSYFREERLFFFEYLCMRDSKNKGLIPSDAVNKIRDYLETNYPADFMVVFEVAQQHLGSQDWTPDKKLIKYFTRLGFRKVDFPYRYPILQSYSGEVSYPADLMVHLSGGGTTVSASEMRTILRCVYFKHYLRWDRPFLKPEQFAERERLIDELYSSQVSKIGGDDNYKTSGDNKRSLLLRARLRGPVVAELLSKIFGPKFLRITAVSALMLLVEWGLGNGWLLAPFVLAVAAIYCLAEDTDTSRRLFLVIISRLAHERPKAS